MPGYPEPVAQSTLEQIQADTKDAMKAGDKRRVGALRLIADALQKDLKSGGDDEVAVLRRERQRRSEAAEAYRTGGDSERAETEEAEAELISAYLPAELSDEELAAIVDDAISATGAAGPQDTGKVMGAAMGKVAGRADGKRVSALVRDRLSGS